MIKDKKTDYQGLSILYHSFFIALLLNTIPGVLIYLQFQTTTMITYRKATATDAQAIAALHTLSWQQSYRGIWSDAFLDGPVADNRRQTWQERLTYPTPNQYIVVAERAGGLCGFACAYANNHPTWGTLLDNLHVRKEYKGQGIGTHLLNTVAEYAHQQRPNRGFYLWVLAQNTPARRFYESLGAIDQEVVEHENPDGTFSDCHRYVWPDAAKQL